MKEKFTNNKNFSNNLQFTNSANCKSWQIVVEEERGRGASQPKLKSKKQGLKQGQGGLTSLMVKTWSCSNDKKVARDLHASSWNGWR